MNFKKMFPSAALVLLMAVPQLAGAVSVNLPGQKINVGGNGSVNIQYPGGSTTNVTNPSGSTYEVNTPGRSTEVSPGSVQTTAGSATISVNTDGKTVQINTEPLDVQLERGSLDATSKKAIISLSGGTDVLIQTDSDLQAYKELVASQCSGMDISTSGDTVEVEYSQPARFFWIFRSNLDAKAQVNVNGDVKIKLPWYSFLYSKNTSDIKSQISAGIDSDGTISATSSSGTSVEFRRKAHMINVVTSKVSANAGGCTTIKDTSSSATLSPTPAPAPTPVAPTQTPPPQQQPAPAPAFAPAPPVQAPAPAPVPAPAPAPTPSVQSSSSAQFAGKWRGSYTANAATDNDCKPGGTAVIDVASNGNVAGSAMFKNDQYVGTGTVDANGNLSSTLSYLGISSAFSGKLNSSSNTGSGTYLNKFGCFGTWVLSR